MTRELTSIAYPPAAAGSGYPKTTRNPGIACNPPTAAESSPYCMFAIDTTQQMSRHFLFAHSDVWGICSVSDILEKKLHPAKADAQRTPAVFKRVGFIYATSLI